MPYCQKHPTDKSIQIRKVLTGMIKFHEHNQIDFEKWDKCIENSLNGIIYPFSAYLNRVSPGWAALIEGDYSSVMPLPVKKKLGFSYIIQPLFVQQLGIFSPHPVNESTVKSFIRHIPKHFIYINYNFNTFNTPGTMSGFEFRRNSTYELDLIQPYPQLYAAYSTNTKRNILKSKKNKVFVTNNSDPSPIIEAFRQNRGQKIKHLKDHHYNILCQIVNIGITKGFATNYSAYSAENNFCAGAIFLYSHNKSILFFTGATNEARQNGAMFAIIDSFIRTNAQSNRILDFEGSNDANLAKFYAGFGSKECVYLQAISNRLPNLLKIPTNIYLSCRNWLAGY